MEDSEFKNANEPLIVKSSYDEENPAFGREEHYKEVASPENNTSISSDYSKETSSCIYKCFYPIILILYYLLCCCFCMKGGGKDPKQIVIKTFKKWIKKRRQQKQDPLDVLLKLYAHEENIMEELEEVRLNPDFKSNYRKDLEFYIPQLCSFCLYEEQKDYIRNFIVMSAHSNLYFSHRILFFLESLNTSDPVMNQRIKSILMSLTQMSEKYCDPDSPSESSKDRDNKRANIEKAIEAYKRIELLPRYVKKYRNRITASNIKLCRFNYTMDVKTSLANETGFMSTPFFIFSLTQLSSIILNSSNREEALFEGLQKINLHLPANVYIPFVSASMRNYKPKIFETKSRAPYLICVEVFRPEEANFIQKNNDNDEESNGSDNEENNKDDIELQPKNQAIENWRNFLIKHKDLQISDKGNAINTEGDAHMLDRSPIRLRSMSCTSNGEDKVGFTEPRKIKSKINLFKRLFKKYKKRDDSLINKIDKFADKKASHFINLK